MTTTEPRLQPTDVRTLTLSDLDGFTVAGRLAAILGPDADATVSGVLTDLGRPLDNGDDDITAQMVVGELLDVLRDLEVVARRARRQIDKAEQRRAAFHQRIANRDSAAGREAAEREQRHVEEFAARKALEDTISRAKLCAEQHGLILEKIPNYDTVGVERWRLVTSERGNRLLPRRFDDPTASRALKVFVRGGQQFVVLPESQVTLGHVEQWLTHHCPPFTA
ncbi:MULTISPECIES: hypothetical protein [unclassified Rhodococcus (in: high G+C Gram-positive bacteria)]|uniref:hypothetical protein n=1 Tax=unclassified Rhodococcus (in: high G+C Gram-positive bacteria) TaxID=192944 RepID=UPI00096A5265|nr:MULTISPECIES: hypothetical protein [unclassified Rhodococcus (in: high G+C Gram-positive bacteria)]